jgi:hypothetical protein
MGSEFLTRPLVALGEVYSEDQVGRLEALLAERRRDLRNVHENKINRCRARRPCDRSRGEEERPRAR